MEYTSGFRAIPYLPLAHGDQTEFSGTTKCKIKDKYHWIILIHHIVTVDIHVINFSLNKTKHKSWKKRKKHSEGLKWNPY